MRMVTGVMAAFAARTALPLLFIPVDTSGSKDSHEKNPKAHEDCSPIFS